MGWWDKWTTVKETVSGWGKDVWNNASVSGATSGIVNFSYNTVSRLLEQLPAALRLTRVAFDPAISAETKEKVGKVVKGGARIIVEDAIPLAVASYLYTVLEQQGEDYLEDNPNEAWLSVNTALYMGLWLMWGAQWVYTTRRKTQLVVRTTVLALEAGGAFNSMRETPPMDLCIQKKCTTMRFLKGSFRDLIEYWSTKAAIAFVGYVPVVGENLAAAFDVYHNGRYVTTLVLPELCGPDQERYLREYPELALSHGITHYVLSKFVCSMIEYYTGVPAVFYESTVQQFLLISQIGIASQMTLPPAVKEPRRNIPDPVAAYGNMVGFVVDTTAEGARKTIPALLKKRTESIIPWSKIPDYAHFMWTNPVSEKIKLVMLPRMLQGERFIDDPVIPWSLSRQRILDAIKNIQDIRAYLIVKIAMHSPNAAAELARPIFGTPKSLVTILLSILKNEEAMLKLGQFRNYVGSLHPGEAPALPHNDDAFLLTGQVQEPTNFSSAIVKIDSDMHLRLVPSEVITQKPVTSPQIEELVDEDINKKKIPKAQSTSKSVPIMLNPGAVIKDQKANVIDIGINSSGPAFFKLVPDATIRHRTINQPTTSTLTN